MDRKTGGRTFRYSEGCPQVLFSITPYLPRHDWRIRTDGPSKRRVRRAAASGGREGHSGTDWGSCLTGACRFGSHRRHASDHLVSRRDAEYERFVNTMAPAGRNPGVQAAVIAAVDKRIDGAVDKAAPLVAIVGVDTVDGFVNAAVTNFVHGSAFPSLWNELNRAAHDQLVLALKGKSDVNSPGRVDDQGNVFLNLGPVADRIKQGLVAEGMTFANSLPSVNASIQIAHLDSFQEARTIVLWLDPAATWLPWATLLIAALALLIAQNRRRTLLTIGIGVAVSMLLAATVVFAVRPILINGILTSAIPRSAAVYLYDTVVHPLVVYLAVVFAGGVALVIGALLAGPISARLAPSHPFKRGRPRLGGG